MKILILGYYDRQNIGDDMFKFVFKRYFDENWPNCNILIKNTDDINKIPDDVNLIICGGGDLVNSYFMDKIDHLVSPLKGSVPIYGIGIGFPYRSLLDEHALDIFDYVAHRNWTDREMLISMYGPNKAQYYPDLGFLLPRWSDNGISNQIFREMSQTRGKKIGVFLSKTIHYAEDQDAYDNILDNMAYFLVKIAEMPENKKFMGVKFKCVEAKSPRKYQIYLLSCCTGPSDKEDDRQINADLFHKIKKYGHYDNIHIINTPMEIEQIVPIFKQFYMTICTRFHAHIFSMLASVPFLSVYSSRKVHNLLITHDLHGYGVKMDVDPEILYPLKLEAYPLFEKFYLIQERHQEISNRLTKILEKNVAKVNKFTHILDNIIWTPLKNINPGTEAFQIKLHNKLTEIANNIVKIVIPGLDKGITERYAQRLISQQDDEDRIKIRELIDIDKRAEMSQLADLLTEMIVFSITGERVTEFNYGLRQQILNDDYNLGESVKWLIQTQMDNHGDGGESNDIVNNQIMMQYRKFDMKYFQQHSLRGFHRSGWSYVVSHLAGFHNPNGPIFDSFLDKTFGWDYEFLKSIGVLPFKKSWVGFFHHTQNETYTHHNLVEVFKKPYFLTSLTTCKGFYVLSTYIKEWIEDQLIKIGFNGIPIEVLLHPTEIPQLCFSWDRFVQNIDNGEAQVVQIGAWYRNSYAIYSLPPLSFLQKAALRGKNMDNYFLRNDEQFNEISQSLIQLGNKWTDEWDEGKSIGCRSDVSRSLQRCHKYINGLIQDINDKHYSVKMINHLTNNEYDRLLSENVVFLQMIDASAVNTVIECIVRKTPIVINRLPAIEEYLGIDYPLYYSDLVEAHDKLNSKEWLKRGHEYLLKIDSSKLSINRFLKDLVEGQIFKSL